MSDKTKSARGGSHVLSHLTVPSSCRILHYDPWQCKKYIGLRVVLAINNHNSPNTLTELKLC